MPQDWSDEDSNSITHSNADKKDTIRSRALLLLFVGLLLVIATVFITSSYDKSRSRKGSSSIPEPFVEAQETTTSASIPHAPQQQDKTPTIVQQKTDSARLEPPKPQISIGSVSQVPPAILASIRRDIEARYPNNFGMQKILIDAEMKDYLALQNYQAPGIPSEVLSAIRLAIEGRYPHDYSMQKILIDAEIDDYRALNGGEYGNSVTAPNLPMAPAASESHDILAEIRQNAQQEWPGNYRMQVHEENRQIDAYNNLVRGNIYGIPPAVFEGIRQRAQQEWHGNYAMQEHEEANQVEFYQRLNSR